MNICKYAIEIVDESGNDVEYFHQQTSLSTVRDYADKARDLNEYAGIAILRCVWEEGEWEPPVEYLLERL